MREDGEVVPPIYPSLLWAALVLLGYISTPHLPIEEPSLTSLTSHPTRIPRSCDAFINLMSVIHLLRQLVPLLFALAFSLPPPTVLASCLFTV